MYASVTTGKIQPGKVEEYLTIYRESVNAGEYPGA
jgi:hypothetical protein